MTSGQSWARTNGSMSDRFMAEGGYAGEIYTVTMALSAALSAVSSPNWRRRPLRDALRVKVGGLSPGVTKAGRTSEPVKLGI